MIHAALGDARTVLNVGAGAGSYEPTDRHVLAVEPSAAMRVQRPAHLSPAINAVAEALPFDDQSIDAGMATLTVHQWKDGARGLRELRRVVRGPIVIMTFDDSALDRFWLCDYVPEFIDAEKGRYSSIDAMCAALGGVSEVRTVPIPIDCTDGFTEAFYARPEKFLETQVRRGQSAWAFVPAGVEERLVRQLGEDLRSGAWEAKYGAWRSMPVFEGALRLIVSAPSSG